MCTLPVEKHRLILAQIRDGDFDFFNRIDSLRQAKKRKNRKRYNARGDTAHQGKTRVEKASPVTPDGNRFP
ncbi:MAG: hypothetical protein P8Z79_09700 [Sedimentisphaerales bacterium]